MTRELVVTTAWLLAIGAVGGTFADLIGAPMPYLIGALLLVGGLAVATVLPVPKDYKFPETFRRAFIATIGALIGATFTPEATSLLSALWITGFAVVIFVILSHLANYALFRKGGYDKITAFYAAMPGGLIEATTMSEANGGDVRIVTIQQFLRIILVILAVPLIFLILSGEAVGSASGATLETGPARLASIPVILAIGAAGLLIGIKVRMPAGQFMGPLMLSALLHGTSIAATTSPSWLIEVAQLAIGTSLGVRFVGITRYDLMRAASLGLGSVATMLLIGFAIALVLTGAIGQPVEVIFIAFAPGGVTEMSLIALSLQSNPVFVSLHHFARILLTVIVMRPLALILKINA